MMNFVLSSFLGALKILDQEVGVCGSRSAAGMLPLPLEVADKERIANNLKFVADAARRMDAQNRPWVGLFNVAYSGMVVRKKLTLVVNIKNSGDVPALNVDDCAFSVGVKTPELAVAEIKSLLLQLNNCHKVGKMLLFPDAMTSMDVSRQPGWITQEFVDAMQNGTGYVVIIGRVKYESPDHEHHQTIFCAYYERMASTFNNCLYGNEAG